jgi:3-hydroxybutyrate dehydrogenase
MPFKHRNKSAQAFSLDENHVQYRVKDDAIIAGPHHMLKAVSTTNSVNPASQTAHGVALITGSTGGIGAGIAEACAAAGYNVMLHGFGDAPSIEAMRRRLEEEHAVNVVYSGADLTRPEEITEMLRQAEHVFGRIDLLVNNAGTFQVEATEGTTIEQWNRTMAVNSTAAFYMVRAVLPGMRARGFGRILNIASALGLVGQVACSAYAASKHAVIGLTRCVALETAEHGITVNAICPGYVRTPLVEREIRATAATRGISEDIAAAEIVAAAHPTRRFITPAQIGALVVFLASEHAASITGAAIPIDGGWTAR